MPGRLPKLFVLAGFCALMGAGLARAHLPADLVGGAIAEHEVAIAGVLDGRRDRVDMAGLVLTVNGVPATLSRDGHFRAVVREAPLYLLRVEGAHIFTAVQTFGNAELRDDGCNCLAVPAIELVGRKKGRIELFFGGDTMAGRRYFEPRKGERVLLRPATIDADLDRLLAPMKPYIEAADFASVNLETVLAPEPPGPKLPGKRIAFVSTPALAAALKRAGVDYVTLGNNHVYDFQQPGIAETIAAVEAAGLAHSGAGHDAAQADSPARIDVGRHRLALLGFVGWEGSNGAHQAATEDKGGAAFGTRGQVRRSVVAARKADRVPIVQYHGGAEYIDRPSATTIGRLREAVDHGAPLAIGHHPHMVHGVEVYRGSLIAPSIGNFMFDQEFLRTQISYVVRAWLENGRFLRAEIVPVAIVDYRPVPAVGAAREAVLRRLFGLSAERGTVLDLSGGHAAVRRGRQRAGGERESCSASEGAFRLADFAPLCSGPARLGRDVIGRGDFELATVHQARERAFGAENAAVDFAWVPGEGHHALLRPEEADEFVAFYTMGYLRDVPIGEYSFEARLKLPRAARVELLVKDRPQPGTAPTARWRGEMAAAVDLPASAAWQTVSLKFARAEEAEGMTRPFRPVLRIVWRGGGETLRPVALDDVALVAWGLPGAQANPALAWRSTHVRSGPNNLTLRHEDTKTRRCLASGEAAFCSRLSGEASVGAR